MKKKTTPRGGITQSTNLSIDPANVVLEEYLDCVDFKMKPATLNTIKRIAHELIQWALTDNEALKITPFFYKRGLNSITIKRWRERSPEFDSAYQLALHVIGDRREMGALKKKFDAGIVSYTMAHYDTTWKDLAEWRHKLRQPDEQSGKTQIVVIEKFPENK